MSSLLKKMDRGWRAATWVYYSKPQKGGFSHKKRCFLQRSSSSSNLSQSSMLSCPPCFPVLLQAGWKICEDEMGSPKIFLGTLPVSVYLCLPIWPLSPHWCLHSYSLPRGNSLPVFCPSTEHLSARSISVTDDSSCFNFRTDDLSSFHNSPPSARGTVCDSFRYLLLKSFCSLSFFGRLWGDFEMCDFLYSP